MTINNETDLYEACYRNGYNINPLMRNYERASLVPAAAVIPALKVYIVLAAVKKLVVGPELVDMVLHVSNCAPELLYRFSVVCFNRQAAVAGVFTLNKSKCSR